MAAAISAPSPTATFRNMAVPFSQSSIVGLLAHDVVEGWQRGRAEQPSSAHNGEDIRLSVSDLREFFSDNWFAATPQGDSR